MKKVAKTTQKHNNIVTELKIGKLKETEFTKAVEGLIKHI